MTLVFYFCDSYDDVRSNAFLFRRRFGGISISISKIEDMAETLVHQSY